MKYNVLTEEEKKVILYKATERPFTGEYDNFFEKGLYACKQCNAPLFHSSAKFHSGCGWPSFDEEIQGAVLRIPDRDGMRTEIICANCGGHLGHVFEGEGFTPKNTRHCVNSLSLRFIPETEVSRHYDTAVFASGCFWGTEFYFQKAKGVISTQVGFTGGHTQNPTYKQVCQGNTGHAEAVMVVFNPAETSYEELAKLFFETHNPEQRNGQGPDIGHQYRSAIFYKDEQQKKIAESLMEILRQKGYKIATELNKFEKFWIAEDYHQDYYQKTGGTPYCHHYTKRF
ncbi:MAG TPA: bifunctional methionine sulfoxide reductase B/A protein [Bacteroidia bacterium]|nr:bifunctional methionine sulfoxide reductase B/A protein [Bacteroidia bacterium]HRS58424.1 bifunctional methionine sulfoxide reductase B/A protein [Bacteroidia bacterium]HRU68442.1 bifunctional methionine sulfoxide reductase B/A protein [Bacteroidia bacterium]